MRMSRPAGEAGRGRRWGLPVAVALAVLPVAWLTIKGRQVILFGQDRPSLFTARVAEMEQTRINPPLQDAVLLAGSSFIEKWTTSEEDLSPLPSVNVGIGGTKIGDHIHYVSRLVFPFNPRALVIYAGSNDINGLPFFSKPADEVVRRVKRYVAAVHARFPALRIYYVGIVETPLRQAVRGEVKKANSALAAWAAETGEIVFVSTDGMLRDDGGIDESLFVGDRLHLNRKGYRKFATAVREAVLSDLGDPEGEFAASGQGGSLS